MSSPFQTTLLDALREAGRIQADRTSNIVVEKKDLADIVTDVDHHCERAIVELIRGRYPDHDVLGEEGTTPRKDATHLWIVDPIDGTKNYAHGYPRSCVSIALAVNREVVLGGVYNATANELFIAEREHGATLNGVAIQVSAIASLERAMVASALTYQGRGADRVQLERLGRLLGVVEAVRSDGCAALDLCDVACGRLDAFFEPGLHAWDTAAGSLIVREAGGMVTTFTGTPHDLYGPETFASNGWVHTELLPWLGDPP